MNRITKPLSASESAVRHTIPRTESNAFEVPNQQQPEVRPPQQTRTADGRSV